MARILFFFLLLSCRDGFAIEFKFLTQTGYLAFAVDDSWIVGVMQSKLPVASGSFQIPNAADDGTTDSTNVAISFYQHNSSDAERALGAVGRTLGLVPPRVEVFKQWTVFRQDARQRNTVYTILDAKRDLEEATASVRLAWPHLASNPKGYDAEMELVFRRLLESIYFHTGAYVPKKGEVIRRPAE